MQVDGIGKRTRDDYDGIGPPPPPAKKMKKLKFAKMYLDLLPNSNMYEKSYMHRSTVTHTVSINKNNFIITGSSDGFIKFWKKQAEGITFVKLFRAHIGTLFDINGKHNAKILCRLYIRYCCKHRWTFFSNNI